MTDQTILGRVYERWNAHDVDGVLQYFTDDLVYTDKAMNIVFNGRKELADFMRASFVSIPDLRFDLFNTFEADGLVASEALMLGTFVGDVGPVKATGREFTVNYAILGTTDADGKIATLSDYWNFQEFVA
jgi:steroid delta-isomerase-like uncharacterized protein